VLLGRRGGGRGEGGVGQDGGRGEGRGGGGWCVHCVTFMTTSIEGTRNSIVRRRHAKASARKSSVNIVKMIMTMMMMMLMMVCPGTNTSVSS
jgi:hypothetical protein